MRDNERDMLGYILIFMYVRGPFRNPNPQQSQTKWSVRELFTLLGHFSKFLEKLLKNTFNPCSHIELKYTESEYDIQNNDL